MNYQFSFFFLNGNHDNINENIAMEYFLDEIVGETTSL